MNRAVELAPESNDFKRHCILPERSEKPLIKVSGLAYLVLTRPNLEQATRFFTDFGLTVTKRSNDRVFLRGRTHAHHILILEQGPAEVSRIGLIADQESLNQLSSSFGLPIQQHPQPLGGRYIALTDPAGLQLEINCELSQLPPLEPIHIPAWNTADHKPRINTPVRKIVAPASVNKLGHTVHSVSDMKTSIEWYQNTLGLIVSDFQFLNDDDTPSVAFMRCDLGDTPTDHHTLALGITPVLGHLHTAFEMDSMEDVAVANDWLAKQGYTHSWGIGRHILGSQIFDYWRDPDGDLFEHYSDGDLFDASITTGYHPFHKGAQHQWGPHMSNDFAGTNRLWQLLKSVIYRLTQKDDLNFSRVKKFVRALK